MTSTSVADQRTTRSRWARAARSWSTSTEIPRPDPPSAGARSRSAPAGCVWTDSAASISHSSAHGPPRTNAHRSPDRHRAGTADPGGPPGPAWPPDGPSRPGGGRPSPAADRRPVLPRPGRSWWSTSAAEIAQAPVAQRIVAVPRAALPPLTCDVAAHAAPVSGQHPSRARLAPDEVIALASPRLAESVRRTLGRHELPATRPVVEIAETAAMVEPDTADATLTLSARHGSSSPSTTSAAPAPRPPASPGSPPAGSRSTTSSATAGSQDRPRRDLSR